jgi:hypothetical protein
MIAGLVRVTGWLAAALAVLAGLFWALVSTPESNVWMLSLSVALVVTQVLVAGIAIDVAMRLWSGRPARPGRLAELLWPGVRLVPALVLGGLVWWAAEWVGSQVEASRGRITAALIARTGWADPEVVFTAARWLVALAAWVAAPLLATGLFGALARGRLSGRWVRHALSGRALVIGAVVAFAIARAWPWLEAWRPALPPTWVQLVFVGAKLAAGLAALALVAASFIRLAAFDHDRIHPGSPPPL